MIILPTAAFVAIALFCYRAKQILENLAYKHKILANKEKTLDPWNSLHFTFNFLGVTILINHQFVRNLNTASSRNFDD